jgi:hypothetical protein
MTDISRAELITPTILPTPGIREAELEDQRKEQAAKFQAVEHAMEVATGIPAPRPPSIVGIKGDPDGTLLQRLRANGATDAPAISENILTSTQELARMEKEATEAAAAEHQRLETETTLKELGKTPAPGQKTGLAKFIPWIK